MQGNKDSGKAKDDEEEGESDEKKEILKFNTDLRLFLQQGNQKKGVTRACSRATLTLNQANTIFFIVSLGLMVSTGIGQHKISRVIVSW